MSVLFLFLSFSFHQNIELSFALISVTVAADLLNIFEVFLPQLLLYPNPSDPLNGDAASLMMKDKQQYEQKVKGNALKLHT